MRQQKVQRTESNLSASGAISALGVSLYSRGSQVCAPLFNQIQINRNKQLGRGKHCGRFTIYGGLPSETHFRRVNCKCWKCSYCGPRRAKRYKYAIRAIAEALQLRRFLTLTLDPKKIKGDPVRFLNQAFAKLRVYLLRQYKVAPQYIRILEFQKNGNPHFHILLDRFIPRPRLQAAWKAVGGGPMVDIRYVDVHHVSRYLSKYLTKELLLSAPLRSRRVTTSRGIKLLNKSAPEGRWTLIRVPIFQLAITYATDAVGIVMDVDGVLESFSVGGTQPNDGHLRFPALKPTTEGDHK